MIQQNNFGSYANVTFHYTTEAVQNVYATDSGTTGVGSVVNFEDFCTSAGGDFSGTEVHWDTSAAEFSATSSIRFDANSLIFASQNLHIDGNSSGVYLDYSSSGPVVIYVQHLDVWVQIGTTYLSDEAGYGFLVDLNNLLDVMPDPADVRYGAAVGVSSGLCRVPSAADVRFGVAVDESVGTLVSAKGLSRLRGSGGGL